VVGADGQQDAPARLAARPDHAERYRGAPDDRVDQASEDVGRGAAAPPADQHERGGDLVDRCEHPVGGLIGLDHPPAGLDVEVARDLFGVRESLPGVCPLVGGGIRPQHGDEVDRAAVGLGQLRRVSQQPLR
jgi:hypothetical protein